MAISMSEPAAAMLVLELSVLFVGISFFINLIQIWISYDKVNAWLSAVETPLSVHWGRLYLPL